jgi:hypothetical protein
VHLIAAVVSHIDAVAVQEARGNGGAGTWRAL